MQEVYFVRCELNGAYSPETIYFDEQAAMDAAKKLMVEQAKKMNVGAYLSAIRTGAHINGYINKQYRTAVARYMREFFASTVAVSVDCDYVCGENPNDFVSEKYADQDSFADFNCYCEAGCTVLEFYFGDRLMIDSNFVTCPASYNSYFLIKDKNTEFKITIDSQQYDWFYAEGLSKSSNLLLVYYALDSGPRKLVEIQSMILENSGATITTKTIGEQISVLKKLGFPIGYTYRSGSELDAVEPGYFIKDKTLQSIPDVVATDFGNGAYLMLVLISLTRMEKEACASEIIEYISHHYYVRMSKSTILRHLKFLVSIGHAKEINGQYMRSDQNVTWR